MLRRKRAIILSSQEAINIGDHRRPTMVHRITVAEAFVILIFAIITYIKVIKKIKVDSHTVLIFLSHNGNCRCACHEQSGSKYRL